MIPQKGLLEAFEEDIFINYDHDDNQALMANFTGWVDTMHESLARRLTQLVGEKPKIWRDILMDGNQPLTETIVIRLSKTAFLVSVLSPSYVKSRWCRDELNEFYKRAANNGGIKINNRSRIFKVVKTPIGDDPAVDPLEGSDLPPELRMLLRESLGYEFYEIDRLSGKLREFWPELGPEYLKKFLERLEDLAQDINEFIKCQQLSQKGVENNIYLAETTPELNDDRNEIKRTLQQHHYYVLPDENLPFEDQAFEEKVSAYLRRSILSIHLVGSDHTAINTDDEKLRLRLNLQHQLAAERVRKQHELAMSRSESDPEYSRLIWMPTGLAGHGSGYQEFLDYLRNDPAVYENADVLCGANLEDLKTTIQEKLKFNHDASAGKDARKRVYLICDKQDLAAAAPLQSSLTQQEYEVLLPFKEGSRVVSGHKENLRLCDAVLIFYGGANTMEWKLKDLRRIDVFRDKKPLLAKGIYVAGPETDQKRAFDTPEALIMKNFGEFSLESIRPFLRQVETIAPMYAKGGET
jgi:hypothetical protein